VIWRLKFMFVVAVDTVGQQHFSFLHNASGWVICSNLFPPAQLSATFSFSSRKNWTYRWWR
jgi:hypothetical protein